MANPQKGDIATILRVTVQDEDGAAVDVSGATDEGDKQIILTKPDGEVVTKEATFTNTGADGKIEYEVEAGVLDEAGRYKVQGKVVVAGGTWRTAVGTFRVNRVLE